jgi:exo-beta-1,3-glucanase (GH17 family)
MHKAIGLFLAAAIVVVASWWWRGAPIDMPPSPLAKGERLQCVSYAPFRGQQTPLDFSTHIPASQIDEDLKQLAQLTDCIRIYSVDVGLDQVPEIAQRHGLKVLLGIWVSNRRDKTEWQIKTGAALAKKYPDTIRSVIVGNEVLLRGEVTPAELAAYIRDVKAQVTQPVTYADVWEFWTRYAELAQEVDFITIHILPYWEDHPISAARAADHVVSIYDQVAKRFAGRELLIGEVGWPSAGRMREGALASPAAQARVMHDLLAQTKARGIRMNVIEAYDQPWKRLLEGTVGGHWGFITDSPRRFKFAWGEPVSNHPYWPWQALGGVLFAALVFGAAAVGARQPGAPAVPAPLTGPAVAVVAATGGAMLGWTIENALYESLGWSGQLRSAALIAIAVGAPLAGAAAITSQIRAAVFADLLGGSARTRSLDEPRSLRIALTLLLVVTTVVAIQAALGFTFNARYLDFPFAPLTAAVVPYLVLSFLRRAEPQPRARAEAVAAAVLAPCAIYIAWHEGVLNWQSLWFCAALLALAVTLVRARGGRG